MVVNVHADMPDGSQVPPEPEGLEERADATQGICEPFSMIRLLSTNVFSGDQEPVSSNEAVDGTASTAAVQTELDGAAGLVHSEPKINDSAT